MWGQWLNSMIFEIFSNLNNSISQGMPGPTQSRQSFALHCMCQGISMWWDKWWLHSTTMLDMLKWPQHGGFVFQAQKERLDLGNVLVGDQKSCNIVLLNDGICTLNYILSVEQLITGSHNPEEVQRDPLGTVKELAWDGTLVFPSFLQNQSRINLEVGLLAGWLALILSYFKLSLLLCIGSYFSLLLEKA